MTLRYHIISLGYEVVEGDRDAAVDLRHCRCQRLIDEFLFTVESARKILTADSCPPDIVGQFVEGMRVALGKFRNHVANEFLVFCRTHYFSSVELDFEKQSILEIHQAQNSMIRQGH